MRAWFRAGVHPWLPLSLTLAVAAMPLAAACPGADPQALVWMERMSRSLDGVSYHGVVTLQRGDDFQVVQVSRRVEGAAANDQMTQLTGHGVRIDREDHPLECVHPGRQLLRVGTELGAGRCGIADQYRFSIADSVAIAGRDAVQIRIEPRDVYRFGYLMAIDRETGLLLSTQTVGRRNEPLEILQFARVSYGADEAELLEGERVLRAPHSHPGQYAPNHAVSRPWKVSWLPRGFTPTDATRANSGRRTYTDGLAVFSVFLEDLERALRPGEGLVRHGGTTSYTRGLQLAGQPVLVTVIGEVPVNTARMVADSVNWVQ